MTHDPIGGMRRRLTLEQAVETPDGAGGVTRTYVDSGRVWARMEALTHGFRIYADRADQSVTHRFTLRHGPQLTAQSRLRHGTSVYQVRSVRADDTGKRFLIVMAEEVKT